MFPFLVLALVGIQADVLGPGDHTQTLTIAERKRTYLVESGRIKPDCESMVCDVSSPD
jgi:hypothetical protein